MAFSCVNNNQNDYYYYEDKTSTTSTGTMNYLGTLSPAASSLDSSDMKMNSPISSSMSPPTNLIYNSNLVLLDDGLSPQNLVGIPCLEILEQPVEKFRFRYKSEMVGTHGSLTGMNSDKIRKNTYPTVQLHNYEGHAIVRCTICQINSDEPHAHRLVVRSGNGEKDDPHDINVSPESGYTAVFLGMGIIHTAKKHLTAELTRKKLRLLKEELYRKGSRRGLTQIEDAEIIRQAEQDSKSMNLNIVRLKFEAFKYEAGSLKPICEPIYSHGINNLKSALTGELKIVRMDHIITSCVGGQEIFILVEKVTKNNIKVRFFECDDEDNEIWSDFGKFSHIDVHHQYAIVFKAPPYKDINIENTVEVCIELFRPSDGARSEPRIFKYKPCERIGRKRTRYNESFSSIELPTVLNNSLSFDSSSISIPDSLLAFDQDFFSKCENVNSTEFEDFFNHVSPGYQHLVTDGPSTSRKSTEPMQVTRDARECKSYPEIEVIKKVVNTMSNVIKGIPVNLPELKEDINNTKIKQGSKDELEDLVHHLFIDVCTNEGNNALHSSILCEQYDHLKYMLLLLSKMKHLNVINNQNKTDETALHLAVKINNSTVAKLLLNIGADSNMVDNSGNTPLHLVIIGDLDLKQYKFLLDVTALDAENDEGFIPSHLAILKNNLESVKLLMEANTNANYKHRSNGNTLLHMAIEEQYPAIVRYLLENTKVCLNEENYAKTTPVHMAKLLADSENKVSIEIFDIVKNHAKAKGFESLMIKVEPEDENSENSDNEELLEVLLNRRSSITVDPLPPQIINIGKKNVECLKDAEFNYNCIAKLSELLDDTVLLKMLSKDLEFEPICSLLDKVSTKMLLNYANVTGIYVYQFRELLSKYGAKEAIEVIDTLYLQ